ncbi:hypothetical protein HDU88_005642 [Geranomyces variabilis]|nr:hypothetical protein HDU88_005642 [Geranomyces variabilis]
MRLQIIHLIPAFTIIIAGIISALVSSFLPANGGEISGSERDELLVYDILSNALNMFETTGARLGRNRRKEAQERQELARRNLENLPKIGYYIALALAVGQVTWAQRIDKNMFYNLVACPTCNLRFPTGKVKTPRSNPEIEVHGLSHGIKRDDFITTTKIMFLHHVITHAEYGSSKELGEIIEFVSVDELLSEGEVIADYPSALFKGWVRAVDLGKIVPMSRAVMGEIREIPPSPGNGDGNGDDDDELEISTPEGGEPGDSFAESVDETEQSANYRRYAQDYGRQAALDFIFGLDMATEEGRPTGAVPGLQTPAQHALWGLQPDLRKFVGTRNSAWWTTMINTRMKLDGPTGYRMEVGSLYQHPAMRLCAVAVFESIAGSARTMPEYP